MSQPALRSLVALLVFGLAFIVACASEAPPPEQTPTPVTGATPYGIGMDLSPEAKGLASSNEAVSAEAIDALVELGPEALPIVTKVLELEQANARQNALEVLKDLQLPESVPVLMKVLARDPDVDVRYDTAVLLGQLGDPRARELIEATLRDPAWAARTGAARACANLCTSPEAVDRLVWMALSDQPVHPSIWARSSLVKMLQKKPTDPAAADLPVRVRAAIERDARPAASGNGSLETRVRGALLLSDIGDASGAPALREAASQQTLDMKFMPFPLYALGQIGDASAVPALRQALGNQQPQIAAYAYDALRRLAAKDQPGAAEALADFEGQKPPADLPSPLR